MAATVSGGLRITSEILGLVIAAATVVGLFHRLAMRGILHAISEAIAPVRTDVAEVKGIVFPNGGSSIPDKLEQIQADVGAIDSRVAGIEGQVDVVRDLVIGRGVARPGGRRAADHGGPRGRRTSDAA